MLERVCGPKTDHDHGWRFRRVQPFEHARHRLRLDQRRVAVEDEDVAREAGQRVFRLQHCVGGAELLFLHRDLAAPRLNQMFRSEEHTSELQSLMRISYAVFCLKKKKITNNTELRIEHTQ